MKKSRIIRSFEPDPDVGEMLEEALNAGLKMGDIINESTRRCGREVIEQMASERLKSEADRLERLRRLSFENPQLLLAGMIAA